MDIDPQNFFLILKENSNDVIKGPFECLRLLSILEYNLTEEQLNSSLIDLYLIHASDKTNGLFSFIFDVASNTKFENAITKALDIIYTLINNFSSKVQEFILDINDNCLKILLTKVSAKVKTRVLNVLLVSIEKVNKCMENQDNYLAIFDGINNCLKSNPTDSVKQKEYELLGLFAKKFSFLISDYKALKNFFVTHLENEIIKNGSPGVIAGLFTGFGYYCASFPLNPLDASDIRIIETLYKHIKGQSSPKTRIKTSNRAAISFFGTNMHLFINHAIKEFKQWHKRLYKDWFEMGADEQKVAEQALLAFLSSLSETLVRMEKNECLPVLEHFIKWLRFLLNKPDAKHIDKRLAVQGLKYFCHPLYKHYSHDEARDMFLLVMQYFERNYIYNSSIEEDQSDMLPYYVQCLSSFMRFQTFTTSEFYCLQRASINMIKTFHELKPLYHFVVIDAVVMTLFYLKETKHFDAFLENIVYQGVVWSCSHQHILDSELSMNSEKIITAKNYFPLWRGLLLITSNQSYDYENRKYISTKIVNELIKTLMLLINKLNVNVTLKEDVTQTDLESAYQVEQSNDFAIFLNVTDFYQEIFKNIEPQMFKHCICKLLNHFVIKCFKYPLISGFYKLFSFILKIANKLELFSKENILNQDINNCKETLDKFLVILIHKMKQFKDDLLISCLNVLLESPVIVIEPLLPECAGLFVTVFEVGRSYIALANMGLTTLEQWQKNMDKEEFEKFLIQIVPSLDSYLRSKSLGGLTQTSTIEKKRKTARALKKRTILVELEPELVKLQKRVLYFIGSQNNRICEAFVSPDNNFERKVTSENLHLKLLLPYEDTALEIYLEPFIMRVVELSLYCSDRKTRVMACELLQAFVIVFLGRTKQMSSSALLDLENLWRSMCMPLLQLSCDIDQVVRQIFEPLFMQLIHWYTSKIQKESPHSAVIIDVLMEGVTHPTNSSLRDFSGKCINEFVKWTIKQTGEREMEANPIYIKVLVKKMKFFSNHPDLSKKLGAAVIFNNIYKELRENKALLSIFSIELLHTFILSLSLVDCLSDEAENVVIQIIAAVRHLKRIFVEKPQIFRVVSPHRRIPSDIETGDLLGLSKWIFKMTSNISKHCRDITMDLFVHIQPLCGSKLSLSQFVQKHFPALMSVYEEHLTKFPVLKEINSNEDCTIILKWLQAFICLLDGYIFVIKNSLFAVNFIEENLIFQAMSFFFKEMQMASFNQVLQMLYKDSTVVPYYTMVNKEQFVALKSSCCLAVLNLTNTIINDELLRQNSDDFWNSKLWEFILNVLFNPLCLGFEDKMGQQKYMEILVLVLNTLPRKLPETNIFELVRILRSYIISNFDIQIDLKGNVNQKLRNILKGLLLLQNSQLNKYFKAEEFSTGLIDKLMNNFYVNRENNVVFIGILSNTVIEHCSLILEFALHNPEEYKFLLNHLYRNLNISCQDILDFDNDSLFGTYLLQQFGDVIIKNIVKNFKMFLEGSDNIDQIVRLSMFLLKYLKKNEGDFRSSYENVLEVFLEKWFLFEMYFEENSIDQGLNFIRQLRDLFGDNLNSIDNIEKWLQSLLSREIILMSEQEHVSLYLNIFTIIVEITTEKSDINASLECIKSKFIPLLSSCETKSILEKMLITLPAVRSCEIFKFLVECYIKYVDIKQPNFDLTYLLKAYLQNNSLDNHKQVLQILYSAAIHESNSFDNKKILSENVLYYVFKHCNYNAFEYFFKNNITCILDNLQDPTDYGKSIVNFLMIELLFLRIPIGSDDRKYCCITEASGFSKLTTHLLKILLEVFKNTSFENDERVRQYKCSAYKALASIISNSVKLESFYEKLFIRQENNEDILWNSLINTSKIYDFPVDFDSLPQKRKILVSIRDELRQQNNQKRTNSIRYIESQRLFNSSLSEDMTKFDFTTTILRTNYSEYPENNEELLDLNNELSQEEIYLETTDINNHELMGTVCGIINNIFKSGICQLPDTNEDMVVFPRWLEGIRNLLLNPTTHKNVKIFWVKVIDNLKDIFKHFARYFIEPLVQFLVNKVAGDNINYFVSDVVVILASWAEGVQLNDEQSHLVSDLVEFLTDNLTNTRQDIFKYNLDLIILLVENWKNCINVPFDSLMNKLSFSREDRRLDVGLHLTSVLLSNGLLPCRADCLHTFSKQLLNILLSTVPTIYKACAEVVGLMLKYLKTNNMDENNLCNDANQIISNKEDINKYAGLLECVAIHYPDIVDSNHVITMLNRLPQSDPKLQTTFLKIIYKRVGQLEGVNDLKFEDWSKYLESQNSEVQLICLEIILKAYQLLKSEKPFRTTIKSVFKNVLNPDVIIRVRMYDVAMAIFEDNSEDQDIKSLCKEVLIQGLVDTEIDIRDKIRKFWSENSLIPSEIIKRFPYLMSNFYLSKTEEHFLGYISYFLLDSLKFEDCEKELFEYYLEDCDFEDYKLETNWRLQHPSVVPLFAQTLKTNTDDVENYESLDFGLVKATQNQLTFAPTQQTVWDKHILQVTSLTSSISGSMTVDSQSSNNEFLNPNFVKLSNKLPRRRFLKDKAKVSATFANRAVSQKIQKRVKRNEMVKEREKKITIYRSYRKGDFPDIKITLGSLIKPLQMLVLHDSELSKILFSVIFKTLQDKIKHNNQDFEHSVSSSIQHIFENSSQYTANCFSALLDILLICKKNIKMDPSLISTVCQQSGLISVGTLLLEEYLIYTEELPTSSSSKRRTCFQSVETKLWIKLAELYKELQEWDLIRTIFIEKTNCKNDVQKALRLESEKRWREAQEVYDKLIKIDISTERQDFYYESCFKCLAHLGEWDKFPTVIESVIPEKTSSIWDTLWDNNWYQQKLLPWYISGQVKNTLFSGTPSQDFLAHINTSLAKQEQAEYLRNKFSEELCMLWLTQKDIAQASQYLKNSLDIFLNDWRLLNPMFGNLRYKKLQELRTLVEIGIFLRTESTLTGDSELENLKYIKNYWESTKQEFLPTIVLSEAKLLYRRLFINLFTKKLSPLTQSEAIKDLKKTRILLDIGFMNVAIEEENYYMTRKYFREYVNMKHNSLTMVYGNLTYLYSNLIKNDDKLKIEKLVEALAKFNSILENNEDRAQKISSTIRFFNISQKLTQIVINNPDLNEDLEKLLFEVFNIENISSMDLAVEKLKALTLDIKETRNDIDSTPITKALVKLAYFVQDDQDQEKDFTLYVLRAMKLGSREARQLFPSILLKDSLEDNLKDIFLEETKCIPTWMFLGWIPQLLAYVDSTKVIAISEIILRIAETYPQAIMYSYRLSRESYDFSENGMDEETRDLINRLDKLLLNNLIVDQFLTALSKVSVPFIVLQYYLKKMMLASDVPTVIRKINDLKEKIFGSTPDSRNSNSMQGSMYARMNHIKTELNKIALLKSLEQIWDKLRSLNSKISKDLNEHEKGKKFSKLLKDYCPWLANFSSSRINVELEIPGQYTGEKLPLVQHHVKISSFRENVSVMSSLRKPIKITMLGMNSREYPFLIKFGEDIRQDQRIQQLFMLMNNIFSINNKNYQVLTYQVVPLTSSLGIIQWVENSISLQDFILKSLTKHQQTLLKTLVDKYSNFLIPSESIADMYGLSAKKYDRNKVIPFYQSLVNSIPWDILRTSVWTLSLTTESFIAFRDNFIKSYSTLCACHWLLGIGDRHLGNFNVCIRNGKVLGIDFGHAFGTATQILPVPELVPIRLTPHILGLMAPLKEKGTFRNVLIECITSLKKNSDPLLATMNVFIQEPSIDWLENAKKFDEKSTSEAHEWYPLQKINQAKRKLEGASSTAILIEDLKSSSLKNKSDFVKVYTSLVEGNPQYDSRTKLNYKEFLTVEEQVDVLIDHATDPNLLGRMYVGWNSFV